MPFKKYSPLGTSKGEKMIQIPSIHNPELEPSPKVLKISLGNDDLDDDQVDEVINGQTFGQIFVTIPPSLVSTTLASSTTTTEITSSSAEPKTEDHGIEDHPANSTSTETISLEPPVQTEINLNITKLESVVTNETKVVQEFSSEMISGEKIENLTLLEDLDPNSSRSSPRKSKVLEDNLTNKNILTRSTDDAINPTSAVHPVDSSYNKNPNFLIHFSESDKLELMNSQNNALIGDNFNLNDIDEIRRNSRSINVGMISGICFSVLAIFCMVTVLGAVMYRRRYINKPQTLSEPDSSGYIDDSIIRVGRVCNL